MNNPRRASRPRFDRHAFSCLFFAADYVECRHLLKHVPPSNERTLLEAKIAWREQRYLDMVEPLSAMKPANSEISVERDILVGAAYMGTKDFSTARMRLDRALEKSPADGRLRADALFYRALLAWMEHKDRDSEAAASELLKSTQPNDRAGAHLLLSWIARRRRDADRQVAELRQALDTLAETREPDEYFRGKAISSLALLCRELPLLEHVQRVRDEADAMQWASGTRLQQFETMRSLGWIDALGGNEIDAFAAFREAASLAPSGHWRILALADRVYLARGVGEQAFADDLLYEADELAQTLSWNEVADEERSALIVLGELFASTEPARAHHYVAKFRSLQSSLDSRYKNDSPMRALMQYSSGMADLHLGERETAIAALSDASEAFAAFSYGWRSALCALGLYQATDDPQWLVEGRRHIAPWPRSWIARAIALADERSDQNMSSLQRRVLTLLLEGKSNADIAQTLKRSPYTVRNHISQLLKQYKVTNRKQLASLFRATASAPTRK